MSVNIECEFPINPKLPDDFDCTPNGERSESELKQWWEKPFIVTYEYSQADNSWEGYVERVKSYQFDNFEIKPKDEWEKEQKQNKKAWFEEYPSGTRYDVRCLDGGAWDRSTWWGSYGTLDEAVEKAKNTDVIRVRMEKDGMPAEMIENIMRA